MAKVALLVGVGNYDRLEDLKPLASAPKDVEAMRQILQNPELGGFSEVTPLIDPDPMQLQGAIEALYRDREKTDLLLLFFSGHGIKDERGNLYFATRMTEKTPRGQLILSSAVPASFVREIMANCRSRRQVVILDCCFSGAFDPAFQSKDDGSVDLHNQLGAEGRVVLTSSSSTQYSFEQPGAELSIYTQYIVEGIETGAADLDSDGEVSVRELHDYATRKVRDTAPSMNPRIIVLKDEGFEIFVARAQITDPKLKYRKGAERYSVRGAISPAGRSILNTLRDRLGLPQAETDAIESQVLQPFRQRLENLRKYEEALVAELDQEYPLRPDTVQTLRELQDILGLRQEDVAPIKQKAFGRYAKQPTPPPPTSPPDPPNAIEQLQQSVENFNLPDAQPEPPISQPIQSLASEIPQPQNAASSPTRPDRGTRSPVPIWAMLSGAGAILVGLSVFFVSQQPHPQPSPAASASASPSASQPSASQLSSKELFDQGLDKQNKGDNPGAIVDYTQAIQLDKNWGAVDSTTGYSGLASAYYNRGNARSDSGDKRGAITDYDQAIKLKPDDPEAYNNRGNARSDSGDKQGAIADFDESIRLNNPQLWLVYKNRGNARSGLGNKQAAIADFDQAIKLKPDYAAAYNSRGIARSDSGDEKGAIADYDQAIKLSSDYADAYYNRGLAHRSVKDSEAAKQDFQKAADLYQKQGKPKDYQDAIDQLKKTS
jgi:tetratricopeptide (TPR) repeat protein